MKKIKYFVLVLALVLCFGSTLSVSAADWDNVTLPSYYKNYKYYFCYLETDEYHLVLSNTPLKQWTVNFTNYLMFQENTTWPLDIIHVVSTNGSDWVSTPTTTSLRSATDFLISYSDIEFIFSNYDITRYNDSSNLFFQQTPFKGWLQKGIAPVPELVTAQTVQILPIAIALLASLIGLVALRKKLPIFLH